MIAQINPAIDYSVRDLCRHPYPGHDKGKRIGCPNYGEKPGCPPKAKYFDRYYDLSRPLFAIYASFAIGEHAARMKEIHPRWSDRQAYCCLYWQGTVDKQLKQLVMEFLHSHPGYVPAFRPEAMGVNVTKTMEGAGVILEWPPRILVYKVALAGVPLLRN